MINVRLRGQLGNVLFQYALAKHLAIKNNTNVKFETGYYFKRNKINGAKVLGQLKFLNINPQIYNMGIGEKIKSYLGITKYLEKKQVFKEERLGFDPTFLLLKDNIVLRGYFQSEKYFKEIETLIRSDLQFVNHTHSVQFKDMMVIIENVISVGLHIRRGDYLKSKRLIDLTSTDYYLNSVNYIRQNVRSPHFFIFSDDIDWCINKLRMPDSSYVDLSESSENPILDIKLMSSCKHNIIANSTFSWWAAWLNSFEDKIIIAPNRWFNPSKRNFTFMDDIFPEKWVIIDS